MVSKKSTTPALKNLNSLAKLMDSQFKIPGTTIKFGLDALIGLVPGAGDFATFLISGYMITIMAKNGASGFVLARMVLNVVIDSLFGAIPVLGDIFDVAFKSNQRNVKLMHEHYVEGRHKGGAWKVVLPVLIILLVFVVGLVWLAYKLFVWLYHLVL
ncbi:MAG TPA: DUF4112 domain-containing protein [Chitinophagaceae bacterium]|nr:DUF4112 domain-containing protein [Chitinophagaceae bacterium]